VKPRAVAAAAGVWLAACSAQPPDALAHACADVAKDYLGLQEGVRVVGRATRTGDDSVELRFEGVDGMNLPSGGIAACRFRLESGGPVALLAARVNEEALTDAQLEAATRALTSP
jgi:hypothetical protein